MYQYQLVRSSSLYKQIEAEFVDITENHLEYWSDNKNQLYEIDALYASTFHKTRNKDLYRPKRSGIEKILQVIIKIYIR
jgi:hypothetical protein